jgi:hypothetical protein
VRSRQKYPPHSTPHQAIQSRQINTQHQTALLQFKDAKIMNKKETMVKWLMKAYRRYSRGSTAPLMAVNAETNAASRLHLVKIKPDKPLHPGLYLKSWKSIFCPLIITTRTSRNQTGKSFCIRILRIARIKNLML